MPTPAWAAAPWSQGPQAGRDGPQAPWAPCPAEEVAATIRADKAQGGVRAACGDGQRHHPLRRLPPAPWRRRARVGACSCSTASPPAPCGWTCAGHRRGRAGLGAAKGWSGSPCCAMVMLSERARQAIDGTTSSSFACDLKKWMQIAEGYEKASTPTHHHAHRRAGAPARRDAGRRAIRLCQRCARNRSSWAPRCARCWKARASPAWPPRAGRRPAWW